MNGGRIYLGRALTHQPNPLAVPLGGRLLAVWPYQQVPHALIVGATGGGKTTLLRVMATDLARSPGRRAVVLCDGKGAGSFLMFDGLAGVVLTNGTTETAEAVYAGHQEMTRRFTTREQARQQATATRARAAWTPPDELHLWIDEYLAWMLDLPDSDSELGRKHQVRFLVRIGQLGREVGVHLLLATQRPDARSIDVGLPGNLKAQLRCRIAASGLMGLDSIESRMAFDDPDAGERVPVELGGALIQVGRHEVGFRVPWLADPTDPETSDTDRQAAWALLPPRLDPTVAPQAEPSRNGGQAGGPAGGQAGARSPAAGRAADPTPFGGGRASPHSEDGTKDPADNGGGQP